MKTALLMMIFGVGLIATGNSVATAQKGLPPGSYQRSCSGSKVQGTQLRASCGDKGSSAFSGVTSLDDFFLCTDDIRNDNGNLKCTKNNNAPLVKKAGEAIASSYPAIMGRPFKGNVVDTLREMFAAETANIVDSFYQGLSPQLTGQYWRQYIRRPESASLRASVIHLAFADVYGTDPDKTSVSPQDLAFWNSQADKGGNFYENIVAGESTKLNAANNKIVRRSMIMFAYKKLMGRNPTKEEMTFWEPKKEIYTQVVLAGRDYLYSPSGAKDLAATIERALTQKSGQKPTTKQINDAILKYSAKKAIFAEM